MMREIIQREEGWRNKPYYCSEGYPTVGYGFKIGDKGDPLPKFTLPKQAGDAWLDYIIEDIYEHLILKLSHLNEPRAAIIISMCYQLGIDGCMKFKNMWKAIEKEDYEEASRQMLDSKWAKQTKERARRHAQVMLTGSIEGVY